MNERRPTPTDSSRLELGIPRQVLAIPAGQGLLLRVEEGPRAAEAFLDKAEIRELAAFLTRISLET